MAAINNLNVNLLINDTNCLSEMCFMISKYGGARLDGLSSAVYLDRSRMPCRCVGIVLNLNLLISLCTVANWYTGCVRVEMGDPF